MLGFEQEQYEFVLKEYKWIKGVCVLLTSFLIVAVVGAIGAGFWLEWSVGTYLPLTAYFVGMALNLKFALARKKELKKEAEKAHAEYFAHLL